MDLKTVINGSYGLVFWFHLFLVILSWVAPFLFTWYYLLPVYWAVMLQFLVFNRCLVNKGHQLGEEDDMTFYAQIFEGAGLNFQRKNVKIFCRKFLYPFLTVVTVMWQIILDNEPAIF